MAKRNTATRRRRSSRKKKTSYWSALFEAVGNFMTVTSSQEAKERIWKTSAWSLIFIGLLSLVACISFFTSGNADQSVAEAGVQTGDPKNLLGYMGATVAELLIRRGFGLFGLVIPVYAMLIGGVMLENNFYGMVKRLFKYVFFAVLWGSTFIAYIIILSNSEQFDLGGGIGYYLNMWLFKYVGQLGVAFLLIFAVLLFFVLNFNAEVRASRFVEKISQVTENVKTQGIRVNLPKIQPAPNGNGQNKPKRQNRVKSSEEAESASPDQPVVNGTMDTAEPELPLAKAGEEVAFSIEAPEKTKKKAPKRHKVENEQLELVIEEPDGDPSRPTETKEFEQLGNDNVGLVKGENKIEKIVQKEDQEIELEDFEAYDPTRELSNYETPPLALLDEHGDGEGREVDRQELVENKNKIVQTLKDYGIEITNIKATIGPTVTLYEIVPAPGVRISKIRNLEDDIALNLAALGIRIIAPIPGRGTIGIEVPNSKPETVSLRGVLSTEKFSNSKASLPIAIGRNISNQVFVADLHKMPHLLIAGATGQGKSVGLNTVISSILYKKHPAEVKFVLIDPKKVEMSLYQSLQYHFIAMMPSQKDPVITDVREAINVLKSLCIEMDQRYELLKAARVRNLKEYNTKFLARKLNPRKGHHYMPFIVLIIDELADMMMIAGKEVEMPIARLAQLARAVGIHLVVATQRPSVNVITGIIKANFPARMSYRVISKVDSRTILDANGADQLIGRGDLLLSTGSEITRIQNAFIDTPEVEKVVDFIAEQRGFPEPYYLPDLPTDSDEDSLADEPIEKDDLFEDAARLVVKFQMGSASLIQRKMKLGYNRAGRIVDQLERVGIVGPHSGSKAREVLISDEAELERYLSNLS
ncbi:MAG: DNA translocase FtsK [Bacteroidota bacterium]